MSWILAAIKAADAALSPAILDPAAAATALNAQAVTLAQPASDVGLGDIQGALLIAATGDWLKIEARAAGTYSSGYPTSPTANDRAISTAKLALALVNSKATVVAAAHWASFLTMLQVLVMSGDVAQATYNTVAAMGALTVPAWTPPLTDQDVLAARKWG